MGIYLSKDKRKTYICAKLFKQDGTKNKTTWRCNLIHKKSDQIMIEEVYLQIILFLKSTFDILLSHKINLQQNWIRIYECL